MLSAFRRCLGAYVWFGAFCAWSSVLVAAPVPPGAAPAPAVQTFRSLKHTSLVELFTSEGCSSCPPADAWLAELSKDPDLWHRYVPVALHVDYWDSESWKDPLSQADFSEHQNNYKQVWHADSMFTPNVVVDGETWEGWRSKATPPSSKTAPLSLTLTVQPNGHYQVSAQPTKSTPSCLTAHVALLILSLESKVGGGENAGRSMVHTDSAIGLTAVNMEQSGKLLTVQGQLHGTVPAKAKGRAVAAWVTACNQMLPLQAVGGLLNSGNLL